MNYRKLITNYLDHRYTDLKQTLMESIKDKNAVEIEIYLGKIEEEIKEDEFPPSEKGFLKKARELIERIVTNRRIFISHESITLPSTNVNIQFSCNKYMLIAN